MSDEVLAALARDAGIAVEWTDAAGEPRRVAPDVLIRILTALGLPCDTPACIAESRDRLAAETRGDELHFLTADVGAPIDLPVAGARRAVLFLEDGTQRTVDLAEQGGALSRLPAIETPGYHELLIDDRMIVMAVAPKRCVTFDDIAPGGKLWGLAVQLYGLRRPGDGGLGDCAALRVLAKAAAERGADAIALNPTHALFAANPTKYSPYSPSSRLALNPLIADLDLTFGADRVAAAAARLGLEREQARLEAADLVDWPAAAAQKFALLRALFDDFQASVDGKPGDLLAQQFAEFRRAGGAALESHARFEALHSERRHIDPDHADWRYWPRQLRDPADPAVAAHAAAHRGEIEFHIFLQWLADRSLANAQAEMRRAGMRIGMIADLAVGMESGGSHAWSHQKDLIIGCNIGAPPDLFNPLGQNWGLTAFSPRALAARGFESFLATLRAVLRHAGGLRMDHAMGLTRLWLIPEGASPEEGAYIAYPGDDLLRLICLESFRHRAVIIGEDLGTVPEGFRARMRKMGMAGLDVLWFTRNKGQFTAPGKWRDDAVGMTSTHDLPTIAGWWRGADIALRERHGFLAQASDAAQARQAREAERRQIWRAFRKAGCAQTDVLPHDPAPAVDAAVDFVAATAAPLVLVPLEDALGMEAQPNLPGTVDEYPNWRQRYPVATGDIFERQDVAARARLLARRRPR